MGSDIPAQDGAARAREGIASICYSPEKIALVGWDDALRLATEHPRSMTGKKVREAFDRADRVLAHTATETTELRAENARLREALDSIAALATEARESDTDTPFSTLAMIERTALNDGKGAA